MLQDVRKFDSYDLVAVAVVFILKVVAAVGIVYADTPKGTNEDDATYPPAIPLGLTDSGTPRRMSETLLFSGMITGGILSGLRKGLQGAIILGLELWFALLGFISKE